MRVRRQQTTWLWCITATVADRDGRHLRDRCPASVERLSSLRCAFALVWRAEAVTDRHPERDAGGVVPARGGAGPEC